MDEPTKKKQAGRHKAPKTYQVLEEDYFPWQMQPWDTQKSYEMFICYYWPQAQRPRSVNEAFRLATGGLPPKKPADSTNEAEKAQGAEGEGGEGAKQAQSVDKRVAPSNWRRWSLGQNNAGEQLYFELLKNEGQPVTMKVPGWNERAKAWDKKLANEKIENERTMRQQVRKLMETTMLQSATKIAKAWQVYTPTGKENLGELAAATKSMFGQLSDHFELDNNADLYPEIEEIVKEAQTMSQGEALQKIKNLLTPKQNKAT